MKDKTAASPRHCEQIKLLSSRSFGAAIPTKYNFNFLRNFAPSELGNQTEIKTLNFSL
ncbi:hypothetical protein [Algoriphagus algorifonticola]|uniref:hypothetical protein n=1 Tax=Algoriphagus algorifonticola TaxID=2593007 RepID=UPI0016425BAB|nr:hypothetical protein [Algoriphagus algorifonticola]